MRVVFLCPFYTSSKLGICVKIQVMKSLPQFEVNERKAGNIARIALKDSFLSQLRKTFERGKTGNLERSTVNTRFRAGRLDRLILKSPRYSFQSHFGSSKTGTQKPSNRREADIKSFTRHVKGKKIEISSHRRSGGSVAGFNKKIKYRARNHISRTLNETKALENLATALGENRIVLIASQIDF